MRMLTRRVMLRMSVRMSTRVLTRSTYVGEDDVEGVGDVGEGYVDG